MEIVKKFPATSNSSVLKEAPVAFIHTKDGEPSEKMRMAFEMCQKSEDVIWLNADDIDNVDKENTVFVTDDFAGVTFRELRKHDARIIGPQCIITCIDKGEDVPSVSHPMFTTTMTGLEICFTNISRSARVQLHEKVKLMGGVVHREFSTKVTHLVAGEVGSKKYHVACTHMAGMKIMLPEWVEECWQVGKKETVHATDKRFSTLRCPIFKGLYITVSQVEAKERKKIQALVENNGGTYSGILQAKFATHLVCLKPTGDKYKVAKQNKIPCIHTSWLHHSVKKGYCLDANLYAIDDTDGMVSSSTPTSNEKTNRLTMPDASMIANSVLRSAVEETVVSNSSVLNASSKSTTANDSVNISGKYLDESLSKKLDAIRYNSYGHFLDGCKIVLSGFSTSITEQLRKVLNAGGATRLNQINHTVSHVILGKDVDEHHKILMEGEFKPQVVNIDWLFACVQEGRPVDEKDFYCLDTCLPQGPLSPLGKSHVTKNVTIQKPVDPIDTSSYMDEIDQMMSQYLGNGQDESLKKLFQGLTFSASNCENSVDSIKSIIVDHGGTFLRTFDEVDVDYVIVPILGSPDVENRICVTCYWIESCIEAESLVEETSNPLFKPVRVNPKSLPLKDCVLSLSQYYSTEKDYLVEISAALGAKYQDFFARNTNRARGVLGCTHLIAKLAEGSKYNGAIKWNIPVVTMHWLLKCAAMNSKVCENPFLVGESMSLKKSSNLGTPRTIDPPSVVTRSRRNNDLSNLDTESKPNIDVSYADSSSAIDKAPSVTMPNDSDSPALNNGPGSPYTIGTCPPTDERLSKIRERIRAGYETPSQVTRFKKLYSDDQDSGANTSCDSVGLLTPSKLANPEFAKSKISIRDAMACLDSPVGDRKLSISPTSKLPIEDLYSLKIKEAIKRELQAKDGVVPAEEYGDSLSTCEISGPLKGLVIVVSKKLSQQQSELNKIVEALGGKYRWKYDKSCTHFIHQGKGNDSNKELKAANDDGKFVVSPEWLRACQEKQARVDESLYPYTYNPQLSLTLSTRNETVEPKKTLSCSPLKHISSENSETRKVAEMETAKRQMEEILAATKVAKDKRKTKRLINTSNSDSTDGNKKSLPRPRGGIRKESEVDEIEPPETLPITWDDPTSRLEREKLAAHLAKDSQIVSPADDCDLESDAAEKSVCDEKLSGPGDDPVVETPKPVPRIMLAGFSNQERGKYAEIIQKIGGVLISTNNFDVSCTHLIAGIPSRTEKYLASLASGKWVLQRSYLVQSESLGYFAKENEHEWGRQNAGHMEELKHLTQDQQKLANAAYRWRTKLQDEKKKLPPNSPYVIGAYKNWNAIVCSNEQRSSSFTRLLEAGSAKVFCVEPPFSDLDGITHAFIEISKLRSPILDFQSLVKAGVLCLKPDYLGHFLAEKESDLNVTAYCLPEVLSLTGSMTPNASPSTLKRKSSEISDITKKQRQ